MKVCYPSSVVIQKLTVTTSNQAGEISESCGLPVKTTPSQISTCHQRNPPARSVSFAIESYRNFRIVPSTAHAARQLTTSHDTSSDFRIYQRRPENSLLFETWRVTETSYLSLSPSNGRLDCFGRTESFWVIEVSHLPHTPPYPRP